MIKSECCAASSLSMVNPILLDGNPDLKILHISPLVSEGFCLGNIPKRELTEDDNLRTSDSH